MWVAGGCRHAHANRETEEATIVWGLNSEPEFVYLKEIIHRFPTRKLKSAFRAGVSSSPDPPTMSFNM